MKKICFVTGSRADYSSLYPVMKLALNSKKLKDEMSENTLKFVKKNYYYSQVINKIESTYKTIINDK